MSKRYDELPEELKSVVEEKTDVTRVLLNSVLAVLAVAMFIVAKSVEMPEVVTYLLYVVALCVLVVSSIKLMMGCRGLYARFTKSRVSETALYFPLEKETEVVSGVNSGDLSRLGEPSAHQLPLLVKVWHTVDSSVMAVRAYKYEDYDYLPISKVFMGKGDAEGIRKLLDSARR